MNGKVKWTMVGIVLSGILLVGLILWLFAAIAYGVYHADIKW